MGRHLAGERCGTSPRLARRQRAALPQAINGRDAQGPRLFPRGHRTGVWRGTTKALNELIESLIDLMNGLTCAIGSSSFRTRRVGVRPIGLLFAIVRVQCKLRRIEAKMWEATNREGFFWATQARGVERCLGASSVE